MMRVVAPTVVSSTLKQDFEKIYKAFDWIMPRNLLAISTGRMENTDERLRIFAESR